jgi:hypothetical protein
MKTLLTRDAKSSQRRGLRVQTRRAYTSRRGFNEGPLAHASLMARTEHRTMSLVTWIAGAIAGAMGWAGLEGGAAPWIVARRATIVRIVAFVRRK